MREYKVVIGDSLWKAAFHKQRMDLIDQKVSTFDVGHESSLWAQVSPVITHD